MPILENGFDGPIVGAKVNERGQVYVRGVTETDQQASVIFDNGWNLNTGIVSLSSSSESAVSYYKNTDTRDFLLVALAVGIGNRDAATEAALITMVRNPTGGTIITDKIDMAMIQNRNFGSAQSLTGLAYKGGEGKTMTGGDDIALFFQGSGRLFAGIDFNIPQGQSIGIKIDVNNAAGADVYVAYIGHYRDSKA